MALIAAFLEIPSNKEGPAVSLDITGAAVGSIAIVALMIGIGEGHEWGWTSAATVGCFVVAVIIFVLWTRRQLRVREPLVDLSPIRHRAVLGADLSASLLGIDLYMFFTVITEFVQSPSAEGFGFGASTLVAGLCLVPFSAASLLGSRLMTATLRRSGFRAALGIGGLATYHPLGPAAGGRQRDGLLPGGPLDRLLRRLGPGRLDPRLPRGRRVELPRRRRLHHLPLGGRRDRRLRHAGRGHAGTTRGASVASGR
ncbi:MAG: hypothetical protein J0H06_16895 [Actinobacteria bacterium]|nr:hypothetical protein [Actinomycetota bacterium]